MSQAGQMLLGAIAILAVAAAGCGAPETKDPAPVLKAHPSWVGSDALPGILAAANERHDLTTFVAAVYGSGFNEVLEGPGPFTVFASTNEGFRRQGPGWLSSGLNPRGRATLRKALQEQVIRGDVIMAARIPDGGFVRGAAGPIATIRGDDGVRVGNRLLVAEDIRCRNGVLHVVDGLLSSADPGGQ